MSEVGGDCRSWPFKEGTIKYACYSVLKHTGPKGLSVAEIVQRIRESGLAKLGGSTPANTIVGQLSKDANFVLVCKATYALHSDADTAPPESIASERTGVQQDVSRKRKYQDSDEVSGCSVARVSYLRPGASVEVRGQRGVDTREGHHGGKWTAGTVACVDHDGATVRLDVKSEKDGLATERFGLADLARRVRPTPPAALLAVKGRELNQEVDVQINQVWTEGKVSKVSKEGQITVTVTAPGGGGGGKDSSALVVFSDTSGQVWAREVWNKKGAKQAALRQGWTFSDTSGRWAVLCGAWLGGLYSPVDASEGFEGEASKFAPRVRTGAGGGGGRGGRGAAFSGMDASVDMSTDVTGGRGCGESSPSALSAERPHGDGDSPPFKSLSDACHHLLSRAGAAGLQVSDMVREIQTKGLVKLGGRTPSNTVYSRLSQDPRFLNVARGAYALAPIPGEGGGGGAASTPSKMSAASKSWGAGSAFGGFSGTTTRGGVVGGNMPMGGGAGGVWQRPAAPGTGSGAHGGYGYGYGGTQGSGRSVHVDDYDMGSVQGDDTPAGDGATTPIESEAVTDPLGSSSVFSLALGEPGAQLAAGGRGARGGAAGARGGAAGAKEKGAAAKAAAAAVKAAADGHGGKALPPPRPKEHGVEALEAELSAGLLMGLRSGGRRASAL